MRLHIAAIGAEPLALHGVFHVHRLAAIAHGHVPGADHRFGTQRLEAIGARRVLGTGATEAAGAKRRGARRHVLCAFPVTHMLHLLEALVDIGLRDGDVRDSVSGAGRGTPTAAAKPTRGAPPCYSELRRLRVYRWHSRS